LLVHRARILAGKLILSTKTYNIYFSQEMLVKNMLCFLCWKYSSKTEPQVGTQLQVGSRGSENAGAIVKTSNELAKTTPAGEYLTSALMEFDPEQFESFAAISDGANKLLMLVSNIIIRQFHVKL
jgi:hypothetical protein